MGVRVTREYRNGNKNATNYVCFGFLASQNRENANVVKMHYHYGHEFNSGAWGNERDRYQADLEELFSTAPMFRNFSYHARKGVVTVSNVDQMPCDELMTGLFMVRNLAQRGPTIKCYRWLRNKGYRPLIAITVCHLFERKDNIGVFDSPESRWYRCSQSEGTVFHQATFGKEAFLRFIRQDYSKREFSPWKQDTFTEQRRYLRDSTIQDLWGSFDHPLNDSGTKPRNVDRTYRHRRYMASALSKLEGKETPLHPAGINFTTSDEGMVVFINSFLPKAYKVEEPEGYTPPPVETRTFEVGVRVRMSATGATRYRSETNPNDTTTEGEIIHIHSRDTIRVSWANGMVNTYERRDLEFID